MGKTSCPETSVTNYQCTLCKIPEYRRVFICCILSFLFYKSLWVCVFVLLPKNFGEEMGLGHAVLKSIA
jgi:hypothetical protein